MHSRVCCPARLWQVEYAKRVRTRIMRTTPAHRTWTCLFRQTLSGRFSFLGISFIEMTATSFSRCHKESPPSQPSFRHEYSTSVGNTRHYSLQPCRHPPPSVELQSHIIGFLSRFPTCATSYSSILDGQKSPMSIHIY